MKYHEGEKVTLYHGDNREVMRTLPDASVDAIVCDPPYELGFMGKKWDASGIAYSVEMWQEALRVLKPGGHLLAFSGSRTYHRMTVAIEDAGFEIRDQIMWIYGSGFPKSLDVSKAIDKAAGAEREVVGTTVSGKILRSNGENERPYQEGKDRIVTDITAPATTEAKAWAGWGTALKPAHEPIVVARKPFIGTVAENVLTYGTGGLNIEASRIASDDGFEKAWDKPVSTNISADGGKYISEGAKHTVDLSDYKPSGRWPANVIHDGSDEVVELFPDTGQARQARIGRKGGNNGALGNFGGSTADAIGVWPADSGGSAARFFYCAKASKKDRNEGLDGFELKRRAGLVGADRDGQLDRLFS